MKKVILIVLAVVIVALVYVFINSIRAPMNFKKEVATREAAVIERIKDIRTAQRAYRQKNLRFTSSFDTLIDFVLNDSLVFTRAIGSADDSVAKAQGRFSREEFKMAAIDTIFGGKVLTAEQVREFPIIPFSNGQKYIMNAGNLTTGSSVVVPVFEAKAPYKTFLMDIDDQQLINLIDGRKAIDKYPGIKVGSMTEATNESGNWE